MIAIIVLVRLLLLLITVVSYVASFAATISNQCTSKTFRYSCSSVLWVNKPWTTSNSPRYGRSKLYPTAINNDVKTTRDYLRTSDIVVVAPREKLSLSDLEHFVDTFSSTSITPRTLTLSAQVLLESIDSTIFAQMNSDLIFEENFVIFMQGDVKIVRECVLQWIRGVKGVPSGGNHNRYVLMTTKQFCMKINI